MTTGHNWLGDRNIGREMEFLRLCKLFHSAMQDGVNRSIRQMGVDLTSSQLDVLLCVAQGCGRAVNQKDIEEELKLSNPTVTGILKRLERKGFIVRTVSSHDRRYKEVRLTEKCARLGETLHPDAREMLRRMFRGFSPQEFDDLNRLMRRLVENCGRMKEEEQCSPLLQAAAACPSGAAR